MYISQKKKKKKKKKKYIYIYIRMSSRQEQGSSSQHWVDPLKEGPRQINSVATEWMGCQGLRRRWGANGSWLQGFSFAK
jgi:hypothetical protein